MHTCPTWGLRVYYTVSFLLLKLEARNVLELDILKARKVGTKIASKSKSLLLFRVFIHRGPQHTNTCPIQS